MAKIKKTKKTKSPVIVIDDPVAAGIAVPEAIDLRRQTAWNSMADALINPAVMHSTAEVERARQAERQRVEEYRARVEHERRHGREGVEVELYQRPDYEATELRVRVRELGVVHRFGPREIHDMNRDPEAYARHVARDMAGRIAREVEERVMHELMRQASLRRADRYGRSPAAGMMHQLRAYQQHAIERIRGMEHLADMAVGITRHGLYKMPKPKDTIKYELAARLPPIIKSGEFKAHVIANNKMLWNEADKMDHCIYKSYGHKFEAGEYVGYHITARHLTENGFTAGFKVLRNGDGRTEVRHDQCKTKNNHNHKDLALAEFCRIVETKINEVLAEGKSDAAAS